MFTGFKAGLARQCLPTCQSSLMKWNGIMYLNIILQHSKIVYLWESSEHIVNKFCKTESRVKFILNSSLMMCTEMQSNVERGVYNTSLSVITFHLI